jgi:hypothetical protein
MESKEFRPYTPAEQALIATLTDTAAEFMRAITPTYGRQAARATLRPVTIALTHFLATTIHMEHLLQDDIKTLLATVHKTIERETWYTLDTLARDEAKD